MKTLYLALAVLGAIVPYVFLVPFFAAEGVSLTAFGSALFANGAAAGLSADLFISSFVFWLYMAAQQRDKQGPKPLPFMALNLLIGLSCALPAYLYARESNKTVAA